MTRFLFIPLLGLSLLFPPATQAQAPDQSQSAPVASGNETEGLKLPPDQEVAPDEGFVTITAEASAPADKTAEIRYIVLGTEKIKYSTFGNTVVVSIPTSPGAQVSVFAVALIDGKLTEFIRHNILIKGTPTPPQPPPPDPPTPPGPVQTYGRLHVTLIEDSRARTPETARILTDPTLRQSLQQAGHTFRAFDQRDPILTRLRFERALQGVQLPALVLQDQQGRVVPAGKALPLPASPQAFLDLVKSLSGI